MDGQAFKGADHRAHHVVAIEVLRDAVIHRVGADRDHQRVVPWPGSHKAQRHGGLRIVGIERVAGHLLFDETPVRLVVVERLDDVISIGPRIGAGVVVIVAVRVGIVRHVEPVPGPVLAVARRRQQSVHKLFVGVGARVGDKALGFFRCRRQSSDIERHAADQRPLIGGPSWLQSAFLEFCQDKAVDRIARPHRVFHRRQGRIVQRLKCPVLLRGFASGSRRRWNRCARF